MAQKHQKHNWSQQAGDFYLPSLGVSVTEQADNLNDHFSDVCCQLPPLRLQSLPSYLPAPLPPTIPVWEVQNCLSKLNASKVGHPEESHVKIIKWFSFELAEPLTKIFNASLQEGVFHLFGKLHPSFLCLKSRTRPPLTSCAHCLDESPGESLLSHFW